MAYSGDVLRVREVTLRWARFVPGLVTVYGLTYGSSHPGQLSLLPYTTGEMSTGQSLVMVCVWDVLNTSMAHSTCG